MAPGEEDSDFAVKSVKQILDRKVFPAGKIVFAEGQSGSTAYILLRGDVTIFAEFQTHNQRELMKVKPG